MDDGDSNMQDASMQDATEATDIELIAPNEVAEEFDLGEAPQDDDEDGMEDEDADGQISAEDADVRDDAEMHSGPVYSIKVNPVDPRIVITGGGDDVAVIWNREDGTVLHTLAGHEDSVVSVGFSFDGKYAATGGYDGLVKIWDVATGKLVQNLEGPSQEVEWVCWHKKGNVVLAGSGDGTVGQLVKTLAGHTDMVLDMTFIPAFENNPVAGLLTASDDESVRLFPVDN
ncbi:hypothetical protein BBJ28_00008858 [Nothophytophthora sp. Chile5]|nr:hypothetical protein BBJ28_00008858 [Nothophytophthora sp. Chile5]